MRWLSRDDVFLRSAPGFIEPCLPTSQRVPIGPGWVYEIKHDGYRLMVRKSGEHVRIYTRRGVDWTKRFPRITDAVRKLKIDSVLLDGEGVVCNDNGLAIFDKLHSKLHDHSVMLYAFDMLEADGADCRLQRLDARKSLLRKLIRKRNDGILYSDHMDRDGELVFEHACQFGCEGIVAKRADSLYRSGRSKSWLKIKNPKSPAMLRIGGRHILDSSSDALATAAMNWRALSLKRLVHWDELRRTGRWRRHFQTEERLEEAVRNANADAERWRQLANRYVALSAEEDDQL